MARVLISLALLSVLLPATSPEPPPLPAPAPSDTPLSAAPRADEAADDEPPEGYYAFVESPNATPPRVRPPPYRQTGAPCSEAGRPHVTAANLCGDLNRGLIPRNPMGQNPAGDPYPFELIRNHTLRFLSRTLPVLRADDTLPRVAHVAHHDGTANTVEERMKRSLPDVPAHLLPAEHRALDGGGGGPGRLDEDGGPRESRKFCDGGGVFCMLYRAINGDPSPSGSVERREDPGHRPPASAPGPGPALGPGPAPAPHGTRYEGPPTPCPARVEYATPVFARNYQGVWRYVVQIPYEGYFTQTVEVTRCMQSRCHYLEGGCLSSPRWVSLLVAELHYPQESQPPETGQYSVSEPAESAPHEPAAPHCDGRDEQGCYQVRLYYDWFLVPGSCKCWRPDYFARYVRRRHNSHDL